MIFHRAQGDPESAGNLPIALPRAHQPGNIALALGQAEHGAAIIEAFPVASFAGYQEIVGAGVACPEGADINIQLQRHLDVGL